MEKPMSPDKPDDIHSHKGVQKYILDQANRLFDGAYEGYPFSRITVPDIYKLINNNEVKSGLFCFSGLNGDALIGLLKQWNAQRTEAAKKTGSVLQQGGFNPSDAEDEVANIKELFNRPRKEPDPEAEFDL